MRGRLKDVPVVIGLWGTKVDARKALARLACSDKDKVARSLREAKSEMMPLIAGTNGEAETKQAEVVS